MTKEVRPVGKSVGNEAFLRMQALMGTGTGTGLCIVNRVLERGRFVYRVRFPAGLVGRRIDSVLPYLDVLPICYKLDGSQAINPHLLMSRSLGSGDLVAMLMTIRFDSPKNNLDGIVGMELLEGGGLL